MSEKGRAGRRLIPVWDPSEIPENMTEEEAANFWSTHEFTEELWEKLDDIPEGELPPARTRTSRREHVPDHPFAAELPAVKEPLVVQLDREERRREEAQKLYFESCKQMTTLNTAAALVVLAIYREAALESLIVIPAIVGFSVSLLVALDGMLGIVSDEFRGTRPQRPRFLLVIAYTAFFFGPTISIAIANMVYGYETPQFITSIAIAIVAVVYIWFRRWL